MSSRRDLLKWVSAGAGVCVSAAVVVPAAELIGDNPSRGGGALGWIRVMKLVALESGQPMRASLYGTEDDAWTHAEGRKLGDVWLLRGEADAVQAFSAVCPHLGCAIESQGSRFFCPCHDSGFGLDGSRKGGPSPRDMDPLEVKIEGGWVLVNYRRFKTGVSTRTPA